jgi:hypothetical protein
MQEGGETIQIKLIDEWPPELAQLVGLISIAFAQLLRVVYLAAKRKEGVPLVEWERDHPRDTFSTWSSELTEKYSDDRILGELIPRARCGADQRDDLIHAS